MRKVTSAERRARLGIRHRLADEARTTALAEAAGAVVGLHATDPASMMLAARSRMGAPEIEAIEHSMYGERTVARVLGMRRTVFAVPTALMPVVQAACSQPLVPGERRKVVKMLEGVGVAEDCEAWLRKAEGDALEALIARGEATATELSADVPALRVRIPVAQGKRYESTQGVSTRVLFLLAAEGHIVRGRPLGSWTSTLYRWAPMRSWLGAEMPRLPVGTARAQLARSWLYAFGPGTFADLKWWTGWTAGQLREALAEVQPAEVDLGGHVGYLLADDGEPVKQPEAWACLLPSLDSTVMGWKERDWYLGAHRTRLFDRNGNAGPTVWWDGRVVGGWTQRKDGEIALGLLEDVGSDARAAIDHQADRLHAWLADVRFMPRFRTPLERELSA